MNKVDSIAAILAEEKFSSCRGSEGTRVKNNLKQDFTTSL
jgi:hypothetical protein